MSVYTESHAQWIISGWLANDRAKYGEDGAYFEREAYEFLIEGNAINGNSDLDYRTFCELRRIASLAKWEA